MPNYRLRIGGLGLVLTGPSSGLERALSTIFEVSYVGTLAGTVTLTLSDGDASSRFYSTSVGDTVGTVTLSPSVPVARFFYAPASDGAKSITMTNDGGLTNPSAHAYTATAATGSATPFRLTRGGSTIGSYATLQDCQDTGAWASGDVVKVAAGTYALDTTTAIGATNINESGYPGGSNSGVGVDMLTIEAEDINDPPLLDFSWQCAKAGFAGDQFEAIKAGIDCHTMTLRGLRMRGKAQPKGSSDSALQSCWWQLTDFGQAESTSTFTFDRCLFEGWGNGIKGRTHFSSSYYINSCVFIDNSDSYNGLHHDIYTGTSALTEVIGCTFIRTGTVGYQQDGYGHFVKSRCRATTVKASRFYAYMDEDSFGGANSLINTPCGGVVEITGNVLIDYGSKSNSSVHNILRSGEQQYPTSGEPSTDPALTTHSYLIAQNTTLQLRGYPLGDGNSVPVLSLYHIPSNDPNGTGVNTGVPTYAMTGSGTMVAVTTTVQNNIVANYDSTRAATFLSDYPDNTLATTAQISDLGKYSEGFVAGDPVINDADYAWTGDYLAPTARTDTNRGAIANVVPAWVPTTAWTWDEIPTSTWSDYMKKDGTGVAPAITAFDPGPTREYLAQWEYSGHCYSRKHHEIWFFGGGHAATTINAASRWNLATETPNVSLVCAPSSETVRNDYLQAGNYTNAYFSADNDKPVSPHSYWNSIYSDASDEFIQFGIGFAASGYPTASGEAKSYDDVRALTRTGTWHTPGTYSNVTRTLADKGHAPRMLSYDGTTIYYWDGSPGSNTVDMRKFVIATDTHSTVAASVIPYYSLQADGGAGTALVMGGADSSNGWQAKFVTLSSGAVASVTVSGDSLPSGQSIVGVEWCADKGYYLCVWVNNSATGDQRGTVSAITVATITPNYGANTAVASIKTMTGTGPTRVPEIRTAFYDPAWSAVIFVQYAEVPVLTFKVA